MYPNFVFLNIGDLEMKLISLAFFILIYFPSFFFYTSKNEGINQYLGSHVSIRMSRLSDFLRVMITLICLILLYT